MPKNDDTSNKGKERITQGLPQKAKDHDVKRLSSPKSYVFELFWIILFFSWVYSLIVRQRLETWGWSTAAKSIVTFLLLAILIIVFLLLKAKQGSQNKVYRNFATILFIVAGAALLSITYSIKDQTLLLKLFAIGYFSFLPAWLYMQFFSYKGKTLWDEYVFNLFRLKINKYGYLPEPPKESFFFNMWEDDKKRISEDNESNINQVAENDGRNKGKSIYEKKYEGFYGPKPVEGSSPFAVFLGESFWPVSLATLLISVGWVLVVRPVNIISLKLFDTSGINLTGIPNISLEIIGLGFLGSYFFILQMLVRRFFQNDLKTSAYVHAIMRIIVVMLLVWILYVVWPSNIAIENLKGLAFVIGVFPYLGWQALTAFIKLPFRLLLKTLRKEYPLSDLDGLNVWYEARLLEEGIEDIQNLATADLVDVMLSTRIPVKRMVDWVDQSLLYLHLGKGAEGEANRKKLSHYGIRTATDLQDVSKEGDTEFKKKIMRILNAADTEPSKIQSIIATFKNEPNFFHVQKWKEFTEKFLGQEN